MKKVATAMALMVSALWVADAAAGNTSTNTSNNSSTNTSSDPWSSNSSSNSSSNESGRRGRVDDYRRDERIDDRGGYRRNDLYEEYRNELGGWRRAVRERGWEEDDD